MNILKHIHHKLSQQNSKTARVILKFKYCISLWYKFVIYFFNFFILKDEILFIRGSFMSQDWDPIHSDIDLTIFSNKVDYLTKSIFIKILNFLTPHIRELEIYDKSMLNSFLSSHCLYSPSINSFKMLGSIVPDVFQSSFLREHLIFNKFFFCYFTTVRSIRMDHESFGKANFIKLRRNLRKTRSHLNLLEMHLSRHYKYEFDSNFLIALRLESISEFISLCDLKTTIKTHVNLPEPMNKDVIFQTNFYNIVCTKHIIFSTTLRNTLFLPSELFNHLYRIGIIDPMALYRNMSNYDDSVKDDLKDIWNIIFYTWPYLKEEVTLSE